jgi:hypothetical protein
LDSAEVFLKQAVSQNCGLFEVHYTAAQDNKFMQFPIGNLSKFVPVVLTAKFGIAPQI